MNVAQCSGKADALPQPQPLTITGQRKWLTPEEAAAYLQVERRTILTWAHLGKLRGYQLSGTRRHVWRFLQSDLDAMLAPPSAAFERIQ
jgi:excisionase family DNA binding protein